MDAKTDDLTHVVAYKNSEEIHRALVRLTKSNGWRRTLQQLRKVLNQVFGNAWFTRNRLLLSIFELEELLGYDGDVEDVLEEVPDHSDFKKVEMDANRLLIEKVKNQVSSGGSTLFFDLEAMQSKQTSVLYKVISEARILEFFSESESVLNTGLQYSRSSFRDGILLTSIKGLSKTAYGFSILRTIKRRDSYSADELKAALLKSRNTLKSDSSIPNDYIKNGKSRHPNLSERLSSLVKSLVEPKPHYGESNRLDILLNSGYIDPIEIIEKAQNESVEEVKIDEYETLDYEDTSHICGQAFKAVRGTNHPRLAEISMLGLAFPDDPYGSTSASFHEEIIDILAKSRPPGFLRAIANFVERATWTAGEGGCDTDVFLEGTTVDAFDAALGVLIENGYCDFGDKLRELMDSLHWGWSHSLGSVLCRRLAQAEGIEAASTLISSVQWSHRKYDCGIGVDWRAVRALESIGKEIIPEVVKGVAEQYEPNWGLVDLLTRFGDEGIVALLIRMQEMAQWYHSDHVKKLFETVKKHSSSHWPKALFFSLNGLKYPEYSDEWDQPVDEVFSNWLSKEDVITTREIVKAFNQNNNALKTGVCIYLQHRPTKSTAVIRELENLLNRNSGSRDAIKALAKIAKRKHIALLVECLALLGEWELESTIDDVVDVVMKFGPSAIRAVEELMGHKDWKKRSMAILVLGLLATREGGNNSLKKEGVDWLVASLFRGDLEPADDGIGALSISNPSIEIWLFRSNTLGKELKFSLGNQDIDFKKLASTIRKTKTPHRIVEFFRKDKPILEHPLVKQAIEDALPRLLEDPSNRLRIFKDIPQLIDHPELHKALANEIADTTYQPFHIVDTIKQYSRELFEVEIIANAIKSRRKEWVKEMRDSSSVFQRRAIESLQDVGPLTRDPNIQKAIQKMAKQFADSGSFGISMARILVSLIKSTPELLAIPEIAAASKTIAKQLAESDRKSRAQRRRKYTGYTRKKNDRPDYYI